MSSTLRSAISERQNRSEPLWRPTVIGIAAVVLSLGLAWVATTEGQPMPSGIMLIPVTVLALVSSVPATAITGLVAILLGAAVLGSTEGRTTTDVVRFAAFVVLTVLVTGLSEVRRRREIRIREQERELVLTRQRERADTLLRRMFERMPELSGARDINEVALRTCRIARDVFGADVASYWQLQGDDCILLVRDPAGDPSPPLVSVPRTQMSGDSHGDGRVRAVWVDALGLDLDDPRRDLMTTAGALAGASTTVRVDFSTVGFLALSWNSPRATPDAAWLEAFDRLADQMALAKTVVRRRIAQQQASDLSNRLQASFLPTRVDDVPDAVVRLLYRPGTRQLLLGGDFLDVAHTASGGTAFLIGDVSGHGPEQAALAATLRAAWRGAVSVHGSTIEERVAAMEEVVYERRPTPGLFVTVVSGELDNDMGSMRYVCAGHPPPLLLPAAVQAPLGGPPLGIAPLGSQRQVVKEDLHNHDGVLLVTDGMFEGRVSPHSRQRLGFDSFAEVVAGRPDLRSPTFLDALADELEERNGGRMPDDAAALLLLRACDLR